MATTATRPTTDEIIRSISELEQRDFELVSDRFEALKAKRTGNSDLSDASLLESILALPDQHATARLAELRDRQSRGENLAADESAELRDLIDRAEWDRVDRVRALVALAVKRGKSPEQLKKELGLAWGKVE